MKYKIKCPQCAYWFDTEEAFSGKPITCFITVNDKKFGKPQKNRKDEIQCPNCGYWIDFKSVTSV